MLFFVCPDLLLCHAAEFPNPRNWEAETMKCLILFFRFNLFIFLWYGNIHVIKIISILICCEIINSRKLLMYTINVHICSSLICVLFFFSALMFWLWPHSTLELKNIEPLLIGILMETYHKRKCGVFPHNRLLFTVYRKKHPDHVIRTTFDLGNVAAAWTWKHARCPVKRITKSNTRL